MPEHIQYQDEELFNPETHHESSDVPVRPLWWAVIIFIVFAVVTHVALWFLYKAFVRGERARMDPPQTQVTRPANAAVPQNQPLLQPFPRQDQKGQEIPPQRDTPVTDMEAMLRAQNDALHTYGWVDRQRGVARIPIEVAKEIAVQRLRGQGPSAPLPAPTAPAVPDSGVMPQATTTTGGASQ